MRFALQHSGRVLASPGEKANCPLCKEPVMPKCGSIIAWHWSHYPDSECEASREPETNWHLGWKTKFPDSWQEVIVGRHRADVKCPNGLVLEFQASPISEDEIWERENCYRNMRWIINAESFAENLDIRFRMSKRNELFTTFRWKHPRKSWWFARKPMYFDLGEPEGANDLLHIKKIYNETPCGGWGEMLRTSEFVKEVLENNGELAPSRTDFENASDEWWRKVRIEEAMRRQEWEQYRYDA